MDANEIERKLEVLLRLNMSKQGRDYPLFIDDYFGIDIEAVWDTVRNNIPPFKKQILTVLESEKASK